LTIDADGRWCYPVGELAHFLHAPFREWSIEAEIEKIGCPVLALQGLDDEYGTLEQIHGIARRVADAKVVELADCGHSPHRDQARELIRIASGFIYDIAANGSSGKSEKYA
jgi:pimeloyl-ACP methyl ester carboxylesterase